MLFAFPRLYLQNLAWKLWGRRQQMKREREIFKNRALRHREIYNPPRKTIVKHYSASGM